MAFISKARRWRVNLRVYAFTRMIRGAGRSGRSNRTISNASPEISEHRRQQPQPQDHHVLPLQQGPSEALQIVVEKDGAENDPEGELRPPESESKRGIPIKEKLKQACEDNAGRSWEKLSIYRIPRYFKNGKDNDMAYVPQIISLGPYHHGRKRLCQMDQHKWRCLHRVLTRTGHQIDLYLNSVKKVEERARTCYEGTIFMSSDEFVEMMILDGCFVIELFRGVRVGFETLGYPSNDPVFSMRGPMHMIQQDMIMLENQIPFFILNLLYCLQLGHPNPEEDLAQLVLLFFDRMKPTEATDHKKPIDATNHSSNRLEFLLPDQGELHCLALFRQSLLHPGMNLLHSGVNQEPPKDQKPPKQELIHCVTKLREAGIKFSKRNTDKFWDIRFLVGSLQIPQLVIHDGTRLLFLNLIAFEQLHFGLGNEITSYVIFMDSLINSPEDIRYLHDCGIVEHSLGSNTEVADLFKGLCQKDIFDVNSSYLSVVFKQVKICCSHKSYSWAFLFSREHPSHGLYHWALILKRQYFGNPWSIISFIAAWVLLLLTFTQTFYAVYSYHRPGS